MGLVLAPTPPTELSPITLDLTHPTFNEYIPMVPEVLVNLVPVVVSELLTYDRYIYVLFTFIVIFIDTTVLTCSGVLVS